MAGWYDNVRGTIPDSQGRRFAVFRVLLFGLLIALAVTSMVIGNHATDMYFFGLLVLIWFSLSLLTHVFLLNANNINTPVIVILGMVDTYLFVSFLLTTGMPFTLPLSVLVVYAFLGSMFCGLIPGMMAACCGGVTFLSFAALDMGMSLWKMLVAPFAILIAVLLGALFGNPVTRSVWKHVKAENDRSRDGSGTARPSSPAAAGLEKDMAARLEAMRKSMENVSAERDEAMDRVAELEAKVAELEERLSQLSPDEEGRGGR